MQTFKVSCVVIIAIVLWASVFVGIRIDLADYSPGALALLRFLIALIIGSGITLVGAFIVNRFQVQHSFSASESA